MSVETPIVKPKVKIPVIAAAAAVAPTAATADVPLVTPVAYKKFVAPTIIVVGLMAAMYLLSRPKPEPQPQDES